MTLTDSLRSIDDMAPDEPLALVSMICLSIVIMNCIAVASATKLRPSLALAVYESLLGIWATTMLCEKLETWHTSPLHLMLHLALAGLAVEGLIGLSAERRRTGPPTPPPAPPCPQPITRV